MPTAYDPPTPPPSGGDWPDDIRRGAELLAVAIDPELLAAFDLVWQARDAADQATLAFVDAIGAACRALGVDLDGLVALLAQSGDNSHIFRDLIVLRALASETGGGES